MVHRSGANRGVYLSGLVLCDFVLGVLSAVLALAVGASGFGYVDLWELLVSFNSGCWLIPSPSSLARPQSSVDRMFATSKPVFQDA